MSEEWNFHLLVNGGEFSYEELKTATYRIVLKQKLPAYSLQIDEIKDGVAKVECYTIKEIKVTDYNHFDSDRIILSHDLFNLDIK